MSSILPTHYAQEKNKFKKDLIMIIIVIVLIISIKNIYLK